MIKKQNKNRNKIIVILGQTATGKSDIAVHLAKKFNGEVISADSRQVYKGLDIGTGKITKEEMQGIKHHMLDIISPEKIFTVADFKRIAEEKIADILKRGKMPIICGGTGFYIQSITEGLVLPEVKPNLNLRKKLLKKTTEELVLMLKKLDSHRLKNIDIKNKIRLIRAIEIAKSLGSVPKIEKVKPSFNALKIGLFLERELLKEKIKDRIISRVKRGMIQEAENLHKNGLSLERMQELGLEYRLLALLIQNKITKVKFMEDLEKEILQYAKRQKTWFKKDKDITWFNPSELKQIEKKLQEFAKK